MGGLSKYITEKNKLLTVAGILHASRAFIGPEVLHIDLTNVCNFNCIACWCRSPLLGDKAMPAWERKLMLPLDAVQRVFDDLSKMGGLRQVKLVGGGEPFMHPDILEIVRYIKDKDKSIEIDINTNFSLVDKKTADRLLELGVDSLTVSVWAGSPEYYLAVHPNQTEDTFFRIKNTLKYISERKKSLSVFHPRILIHDVILKLNYKDIGQMLKFALELDIDGIQFVPVDPVKGKTEGLLLNGDEKKELLGMLRVMRERYDIGSLRYNSEKGNSIALPDFLGFIQRVEELNITSGAYDEKRVEKIPCYAGWLFARIMSTGNVVPCCKGHRMIMGNIHKNTFREIWNSRKYREFRYKGKTLDKSDPYFSLIGNNASEKTGCYNCDNLWQNEPMHNLITSLPAKIRENGFLVNATVKR